MYLRYWLGWLGTHHKGHIYMDKFHFITHVKRQIVQRSIDEGKVMVPTDGRKETQWCFLSIENMIRFDTGIRGNTNVEVTPPEESRSDLICRPEA